MRRAYREQLDLIENAIQTERIALQETQAKRWDGLYKQRDKDELTCMDEKTEQIQQFERDLKQIILDHQEQYRTTKIQLETDIKLLQQEYELVKATCLMNGEKLDYNYQVLKKREDENKIVRSQQKRRLNKLQDTINAIKAKYLSTKKNSDQEIKKLTDEVVHLHDNIVDIEIKAEIFLKTSEKTYGHLWSMNRTEAVSLLDQILKIDKALYEQQLGLEWTPPTKNILYKKDLPSYVAALKKLEVQSSTKIDVSKKGSSTSSSSEAPSASRDSAAEQVQMVRLLRHILQQIADNTGFLIESRLIEILKPYARSDTTLIALDNVFNALGINCEADILSLREFFLPYVHCSICSKMEDEILIEDQELEIKTQDLTGPPRAHEPVDVQSDFEGNMKKSSISKEPQKVTIDSPSSDSSEEKNIQEEICEIVDRVGHFSDDTEKTHATILTPAASICDSIKSAMAMEGPIKSAPRCSDPTHPLEVESVFAIRALRDFATKYFDSRVGDIVTMSARLSRDRVTLSRLISEEDVSMYWKRFQEIFGPQKERLWDALLSGLKKYHAILKDRSILDTEVCQLRKQNAELKRLLGHYLPAKQKNILPPIPKK